jgi:hypothetical protein
VGEELMIGFLVSLIVIVLLLALLWYALTLFPIPEKIRLVVMLLVAVVVLLYVARHFGVV